jgi:hypothetical protein
VRLDDSRLDFSACSTVHVSSHEATTHLVDHVLEFGLGGVLTQRSHNGTKLFGSDGSISIYFVSPKPVSPSYRYHTVTHLCQRERMPP